MKMGFPRNFTPASEKSRTGFTLVEMLVVISIIAFLALLAIPAAKSGMARSRMAKSLSHMKQVTTGVLGYVSDNNGLLPPLYETTGWNPPYWTTRVHPYVYGKSHVFKPDARHAGEVFYSPSVTKHHPIGDWALNSHIAPFRAANLRMSVARVEKPAGTAMLFEGNNVQGTYESTWYFNVPLARVNPGNWLGNLHQGVALVSFCDGSVRSFPYDELLQTWVDMAGPDLDAQ